MSDRIAQLATHLHMRARIHETLRDGEAIDYAQVRAWAPTLRETAEELTALEAERDVLRTALEEIGGFDCVYYDKHLAPKPCGRCFSCIARAALAHKEVT